MSDLKRDALVMSNARRIIKKSRALNNWVLYKTLFGTGSGRAFAACSDLGLDPESNVTSYSAMIDHIKNQSAIEVA